MRGLSSLTTLATLVAVLLLCTCSTTTATVEVTLQPTNYLCSNLSSLIANITYNDTTVVNLAAGYFTGCTSARVELVSPTGYVVSLRGAGIDVTNINITDYRLATVGYGSYIGELHMSDFTVYGGGTSGARGGPAFRGSVLEQENPGIPTVIQRIRAVDSVTGGTFVANGNLTMDGCMFEQRGDGAGCGALFASNGNDIYVSVTNSVFLSDPSMPVNEGLCVRYAVDAQLHNLTFIGRTCRLYLFQGDYYNVSDVNMTCDPTLSAAVAVILAQYNGQVELSDVSVSNVRMESPALIFTDVEAPVLTRVSVSNFTDFGQNAVVLVTVGLPFGHTVEFVDCSFTDLYGLYKLFSVTNYDAILHGVTVDNAEFSQNANGMEFDNNLYVYRSVFSNIRRSILDDSMFYLGFLVDIVFEDVVFRDIGVWGYFVDQELAVVGGGGGTSRKLRARLAERGGESTCGAEISFPSDRRGGSSSTPYYLCDVPPANFTRCTFDSINTNNDLLSLSELVSVYVHSCSFVDVGSSTGAIVRSQSPFVPFSLNATTFERVTAALAVSATDQADINIVDVAVTNSVFTSAAFYLDAFYTAVTDVTFHNTTTTSDLVSFDRAAFVTQLNVTDCEVSARIVDGTTVALEDCAFADVTSTGLNRAVVECYDLTLNGTTRLYNATNLRGFYGSNKLNVGGFVDIDGVEGDYALFSGDIEFDDGAPGEYMAVIRNYDSIAIDGGFLRNANNILFENTFATGPTVDMWGFATIRNSEFRGFHVNAVSTPRVYLTDVYIENTAAVALDIDHQGGTMLRVTVVNSNGGIFVSNTAGTVMLVEDCDFSGGPGGTVSGFEIHGNAEVYNTRFSGFSSGDGGGLAVESNAVVRLVNATISGNTGSYGGGIYADYGELHFSNGTQIVGNSADQFGGGIYETDTPLGSTVDAGTIIDANTARFGGGGIFTDSSFLEIGAAFVFNNEAPVGGGVMIAFDSDVTLNGTHFLSNTGESAGGAVQCESQSHCYLRNIVATDNDAGSGGGVFAQFSTLHLNGSYIGGNTASISGSGLSCFTGSVCNVGGSEFDSNIGAPGVQILLGGELGMSGSLLHDHDIGLSFFAADVVYVEDTALTGHSGRAIDNSGSPMDLNGVIVRENSGNVAIAVSGSNINVALSNMFIASNSGVGIGCDTSTFSLDDSIICDNAGGGVACKPTCVITGNSGGCSANNTECGAQCEADDYCVPVTGFYTGPYDGCFECGGSCDTGTYNCTDNAVCIDIPAKFGDYGCECAAGFVGNGFVQCNNTDECATGTHTCSPDATCTDTFGSFVCECKAGFNGNGVTCENIDECGTGDDTCSDDAVCTDSHGSYVCDCVAGFYGSGPNCSLCEEHSTSTLGSAKAWNECTCDGGYYRVTTDSNCERCPAGYRRILVPDACVPCGTGTYSLVPDSLTCTSCPEGMVTSGPGAPSSDECYCPYGFIKSSGGVLCEVACYPGTYRLATDGCAFCSVGTYTNITNAYECTECPAGSTTADQGAGAASNCTCLPSFYREDPTDFHSKCLRYCPAGSARPADDKCSVCPSDTYTDAANLEECIECPDRAKSGSNSTKLTDCRCPRDTYSPDLKYGTVCLPCPEGGQCRGGRNPPESRPNYYPVDGGGFAECSPPEACAGNGQCARGYTGKLCSACDTGYYRLDGKCRKCSGAPGFVLFMFFVCLLAFCAALTWFNTKERALNRFASVVIGINSLQVVAMYGRLELRWPAVAQWFFDALSIFNFNIELFAPECASPGVSAFWLRWTMTMFMPLMAGSMFALIYAVLVAVVRSGKAPGLAEYTPAYIGWTILRAFFQLMTFVYLPLTAAVFEYFDCIPDPNGEVVVSAARDTLCYTPTYWSFLIVALLGVILYPIGVPAAAGYLLWRNHGTMNHIRFELKFGFLVGRYLSDHYYYELLIMARKLGIALVFSFVFQLVYIKAGAGIAVLLAFYSAQLSIQPYRHRLYNEMEMVCLACAILVLLFTVTFQAVDVVPGARDAGIVTVLLINLIMITVGVGLDIQRQIADSIEARADGGTTLFVSTVNDSQASEKEFDELRAVPMGFVAGHNSGLVSVGQEVTEESESIAWTTEDEGSQVISLQPMDSHVGGGGNDSDSDDVGASGAVRSDIMSDASTVV